MGSQRITRVSTGAAFDTNTFTGSRVASRFSGRHANIAALSFISSPPNLCDNPLLKNLFFRKMSSSLFSNFYEAKDYFQHPEANDNSRGQLLFAKFGNKFYLLYFQKDKGVEKMIYYLSRNGLLLLRMPRDHCHCSVFYPFLESVTSSSRRSFPSISSPLFFHEAKRKLLSASRSEQWLFVKFGDEFYPVKKIEETAEIEEKWNIILYLSRNDLPFAIRAKNGERINWTTALINFTSRRAVMHAARLRVPVTRWRA